MVTNGTALGTAAAKGTTLAIGPRRGVYIDAAERLAVGWLERRTPEELEVYSRIVAVAHSIIAEAFSDKVMRDTKSAARS